MARSDDVGFKKKIFHDSENKVRQSRKISGRKIETKPSRSTFFCRTFFCFIPVFYFFPSAQQPQDIILGTIAGK
jgi:hypothetical protein